MQAPEVIMRRVTTKAADYWALGVLIFEMLVGDPPFMSTTGDPWDTFRRSMTGRCQVPSFVSEQAADLIYKLLQVCFKSVCCLLRGWLEASNHNMYLVLFTNLPQSRGHLHFHALLGNSWSKKGKSITLVCKPAMSAACYVHGQPCDVENAFSCTPCRHVLFNFAIL